MKFRLIVKYENAKHNTISFCLSVMDKKNPVLGLRCDRVSHIPGHYFSPGPHFIFPAAERHRL